MKKGLSILVTILLMAVMSSCNTGMIPVGGESEGRFTSYSESMYYPLYMLSNWWGWGEFTQASYLSDGTVVVVQPGTAWSIDKGSTAERMVMDNEVRTIVLAGVGSSSRGTAALAKLVANELNEPVAGIVTGYGDISTSSEGVEGYFVGRSNNEDGTYYDNDASYKLALLLYNGARPTRIIGHSKGAMDAANALYLLDQVGCAYSYSQTTFTTFGMGVFVPSGLAGHVQYIGTADTLGSINTVNESPMTYVQDKGHSLNPVMSMHIPIDGKL